MQTPSYASLMQLESVDQLRKVWDDIKKLSSVQRGILSMGNFASLFNKYQQLIQPILQVSLSRDLFDILDEDNVARL